MAHLMTTDDHKTQATVHAIDGERRYVKAIDPNGIDYFIFYNAFETMREPYYDIGDVRIGTHVRGVPIWHPKGKRLIEVHIVEL